MTKSEIKETLHDVETSKLMKEISRMERRLGMQPYPQSYVDKYGVDWEEYLEWLYEQDRAPVDYVGGPQWT